MRFPQENEPAKIQGDKLESVVDRVTSTPSDTKRRPENDKLEGDARTETPSEDAIEDDIE